MKQPSRCLLVGTGSVGQRHVRALRSLEPEIEIVALRSGRGQPLPAGIVDHELYDSDEALALHPDCAIIANPAPLHAESAIPLVSTGIPVLLEKPLAVDAVAAQALLSAGRNNSRILVGYVLRHDAGLTRFREALRSGLIGKLVTLHLEAGQALAEWRPGINPIHSISAQEATGGGVIFELSHEIDSARWLLGDIVITHAIAGRCGELSLEVEDTAVISGRSSTGALVLIQIDMARQPMLRRYRAIGTAGTLIWTADEGHVYLEHAGGTRLIHAAETDRDELFRCQMAHFLAVVRGETAPICSLEDGARTLDSVLRARREAGLAKVDA
jgi:predicted dehydrogenase